MSLQSLIILSICLYLVNQTEGYTCRIPALGGRIQEGASYISGTDCANRNSPGGQCVALVKCLCNGNGRYPPKTSCWRPGTPLKKPDGKCDSSIPHGTAIATFTGISYKPHGSNGHAAIFIGCSDDHTIRVVDQWCGRSIGHSDYTPRSKHNAYDRFHVITNSGERGCSEPTSMRCRGV